MIDLRYTIRSLVRARWFTVGAVLTFAVGIGLNVAVFSIVDRVLFRSLPYGDVDRLVLLRSCNKEVVCGGGFPSLVAFEGQRRLKTIDGIAVAAMPGTFRLSDAAEDRPLRLSVVSANLLEVLGVRPLVGRDFDSADLAEKRRVALIGHHTWISRFGGSTDVIGAAVGTGTTALTVIGVLPADFIPPTWTAVDPKWDGIALETARTGWASIGPTGMVAVPVARLASGASLEASRAEVDTLVSALGPELRGRNGELPLIRVDPIQASLFSRFTDNAWLIVAATVVLLLLACANLATMLLARGRSREHTTAIHAAIGATPGRLVRVAAAESIIVCLAGAAVALLTVAASGSALLALLPPLFARYAAGATDPRVFVVAFTAALGCAVLAAIGPAVRTARVDVLSLLQRSSSTNRVSRLRGGRALLAIEAALGVSLVLSGVIVVRSFTLLAGEDLGYEPAGLHALSYRRASPAPPPGDPEARLVIYKQAIDTLASTPGVEVAAGADSPVAAGFAPMRGLTRDDSIRGARFQVSADYFEALRTRFLAGRAFTKVEVDTRARVAILNRSAVQAFFPHESPSAVVGREVIVDDESPRTVVGIIPDLKQRHNELTDAALFLPLGVEPSQYPAAVIRVARGRTPPLADLQRRLSDALGYRVIPQTSAMAEWLDGGLTEPRFRAVLFGVLSGAALLLAAVGLFAVSSFETLSRRYEVGVRLTLGAQRSQIRRMVLIDACRPVILGVALGLVVASWSERYLQSFMYGVQPRDPVIYASVVAILLGTALVAAWLPAARASRLDPADVLRAQ